MRSYKIVVGGLLGAALFTGCFKSTEEPGTDTGIKAQYYVAVGNSLTSGFQSNGLKASWQKLSYPALLAKSMGVDADFQLPLIDSPGVSRTKVGGKNTTPYYLDSTGKGITYKVFDSSMTVSSLLLNGRLDRPYNNLGVPGASTKDFIYAYDSSSSQSGNNGFFNIVLRGGVLNNTSMMRQAILLKPTVMTMWIGNNDILGGITAGTVIEGTTVTPTAAYTAMMDKAFDTLMTETTARIFVANIPSITTIPFATTVPTWIFNPATFMPVKDTALKFGTEETDVKLVLLPALELIKLGYGIPDSVGHVAKPLPASVTLTTAEVTTAIKLTTEYNAYLKKKCEDNPTRLTLVDVNTLLGKLYRGEVAGLNGKYPLVDATGQSAFSLDGIHPNAKGYKEVAKLFLEVINTTLGKTYPMPE